MDSINFRKKEKEKISLLYKELYFLISSLLVIRRKRTAVDKVVSLRDPGSFLVVCNYSEQATVSVAVSFLSNKVNGTALLSKHIVGINPSL